MEITLHKDHRLESGPAINGATLRMKEETITLKVLLVDDSDDFLDSAARFLSQHEHLLVVGLAKTAEEAIPLMDRAWPDLVLIDIALPKMNGLEATRQIKARPEPPRVIVVTLFDDEGFRIAAAKAGADGFIAKRDFAGIVLPSIDRLFEPNQKETA